MPPVLDDFRKAVEAALGRRSRAGVATAAGLPRDAIRSILDGHEPKLSRVADVCDALGLEFYIGPPREWGLAGGAGDIDEAPDRQRVERSQAALSNRLGEFLNEIATLRREVAALTVAAIPHQPLQDAGTKAVLGAGASEPATEAQREQATQRLAVIERSDALKSEGKSRAEADAIAGKEAGVSASAVGAWRGKVKGIANPIARQEALLDRPRTGRPTSLDASMQKTLEGLATLRGRHLTAKDARQALIEHHGEAPNVSTIRRWLNRWQDEHGDGRLEPGQPLPPRVKALANRDRAEAPSVGDHNDLFDQIIDLVITTIGPLGRNLSDEESERLQADIRALFLQMDDEEPEEGAARAADRVV